MSAITFPCPHCGSELTVDDSAAGATAECPECSKSLTVPKPAPQPPSLPIKKKLKTPSQNSGISTPPTSNGHTQYKVIAVCEGALGTVFLGRSSIPLQQMENTLNREVAKGWQVVFQVVEQRRFFLFWKREAVIITLGR